MSDNYEDEFFVEVKREPIRVDAVTLSDVQDRIEEIDYGCFNDPEVWEPMFASGELSFEARHQLDEPLMTSASLRHAVGYAEFHNIQRAQAEKIEKYGYIQVRTRTVSRTPWREVSYEERQAAARR